MNILERIMSKFTVGLPVSDLAVGAIGLYVVYKSYFRAKQDNVTTEDKGWLGGSTEQHATIPYNILTMPKTKSFWLGFVLIVLAIVSRYTQEGWKKQGIAMAALIGIYFYQKQIGFIILPSSIEEVMKASLDNVILMVIVIYTIIHTLLKMAKIV